MGLFGPSKTPQEMLREYKRMVDRSVRELDRERAQMQNQEKKLISEIKKVAKEGQMGAAKIMAKDLVRTRAYITKFYNMRTQLQAVGLRLQTLKSTAAMTDAMKGVSKAMVKMNKQVNLPAMQQIMMEFAKQSELMDAKQEMMGDTLDDVVGEDNEEEESDQVVNQVLDEIGISLNQQLGDAPSGHKTAVAEGSGAKDDADQDLMARLEALRKS
mmetsp:Transcript_8006/g.12861  ORF Transcript_8006/g.12861 Transcript_8006/m.12861 type:complete len:214 (+) Transcript_8006:208-849(+)|eukprot:CAMPEP_0184653824 /NCGR_PEP_ID=MMETSP0308-20130426/11533_1 /TAXON_ID=38269 /ORGANISM="Gloeochaete witrockiana, Strain SAG 46.84" /LENGTH=213 /DNA_ID=CAMNT_0027089477 /DNA_START=183 /DNA_END=824 /DNA_ORIENTATION=+